MRAPLRQCRVTLRAMWNRKICARKTGLVSDEAAECARRAVGGEARQEGSKRELFQHSRWELGAGPCRTRCARLHGEDWGVVGRIPVLMSSHVSLWMHWQTLWDAHGVSNGHPSACTHGCWRQWVHPPCPPHPAASYPTIAPALIPAAIPTTCAVTMRRTLFPPHEPPPLGTTCTPARGRAAPSHKPWGAG